jgi:hypothetical protein
MKRSPDEVRSALMRGRPRDHFPDGTGLLAGPATAFVRLGRSRFMVAVGHDAGRPVLSRRA